MSESTCSCKGLGFSSADTHGDLQVPGDSMPPSDLQGHQTYMWAIDTCATKHLFTQNKIEKSFQKNKKIPSKGHAYLHVTCNI